MEWSRQWIENNLKILADDASLYIWLGADQRDHFQPLPDFMILMRNYPEIVSRSFITMRNQRGYGTQKNWMAVRQECLYYTKGNPVFDVLAEYTDIPKILRGYYKEVNGQRTENFDRSKSENIRAGNVWVDVQQVFYRMQENLAGCYAQKPLKAIERIVKASSREGDLITDFFAHSGTTLLAGEMLKRKVYTFDIDPIFAELAIRRLEHFRKTGKTGFQVDNPFPEVADLITEHKLKTNSEIKKTAPISPSLFEQWKN
jgi:site-specific DNA-methyltransferase (adenine-specific)